MLKLPETEISLSEDSKFSVHGLSLMDIMNIYWKSPDDLSNLFADLVKDYQQGNPVESLHKVVVKIPLIVAQVIALAAGYEFETDEFKEAVKRFSRLPLGCQADALTAIANHTFSSDMPPKKFLGLLMEMLGSKSL